MSSFNNLVWNMQVKNACGQLEVYDKRNLNILSFLLGDVSILY